MGGMRGMGGGGIIVFSLAANGAQRFLILNTGVSTTGPLKIATNNLAARGIRVALASILDLGRSAEEVIENKAGSHANEHETSMVLAIDAAVVRMELAAAEIQPWMSGWRTLFGIKLPYAASSFFR